MKKIISALVLIGAVLLCSCSAPSNTEGGNSSPAKKQPLDDVTQSSSDGYYDLGFYKEHTVITYIDYKNHQQVVLCGNPNCTHTDESCPAYIPDSFGDQVVRLCVVGNQLLRFQMSSSEELPANLWAFDLDGQNPRKVCEFPSNWALDGYMIEDGEALYFKITEVDPKTSDSTQSIVKVNVKTGKYEPIYELEPNVSYVLQKAYDRYIWLNGSFLEGDTQVHAEFSLLNVDTGELKENIARIDDSSSMGILADNSKIYFVDDHARVIRFQDEKLGTSGEISFEPLLEDAGIHEDKIAYVTPPIDGKSIVFFIFDDGIKAYLMDLGTGEWSPYTLFNRYKKDQLISVKAETENDLLVQMDWMIENEGQENQGNPRPQYALLSKEDYFASRPNYQLIKMLDAD